MKDSKERLGSVIYTYSGTDQEFDEFLKMMIHDYLAVDHPYSEQPKACFHKSIPWKKKWRSS